ncbi:hypothetical protein HMPREF1579_01105 [Gardnerella vaginalis JCP8066]|nr:hypothetical protein HMPREF1579_01105 [Gardnerella vaginalis JCP8066]
MKAQCAFNASEDVRALRPRERHDLIFCFLLLDTPFRATKRGRFAISRSASAL